MRSIIARRCCDPGCRVKAKRQRWPGREETLNCQGFGCSDDFCRPATSHDLAHVWTPRYCPTLGPDCKLGIPFLLGIRCFTRCVCPLSPIGKKAAMRACRKRPGLCLATTLEYGKGQLHLMNILSLSRYGLQIILGAGMKVHQGSLTTNEELDLIALCGH
ncbi:hypothetical protein BDW67DRAFT_77313 [Aspergillus spinulosporus]